MTEFWTDSGSPAELWQTACKALETRGQDAAWYLIKHAAPSDDLWHSLNNCVAYQTGVWQNMVENGEVDNVRYPAAFMMALLMRHTPIHVAANLVADLLHYHPENAKITKYILALLTDDNPQPTTVGESVVPQRDLRLFGDCELCVLAAPVEEYDEHSSLVRAEYCKLTQRSYIDLRIKVLNQLSSVPQLFDSPEFGRLEGAARENIVREIASLEALRDATQTTS